MPHSQRHVHGATAVGMHRCPQRRDLRILLAFAHSLTPAHLCAQQLPHTGPGPREASYTTFRVTSGGLCSARHSQDASCGSLGLWVVEEVEALQTRQRRHARVPTSCAEACGAAVVPPSSSCVRRVRLRVTSSRLAQKGGCCAKSTCSAMWRGRIACAAAAATVLIAGAHRSRSASNVRCCMLPRVEIRDRFWPLASCTCTALSPLVAARQDTTEPADQPAGGGVELRHNHRAGRQRGGKPPLAPLRIDQPSDGPSRAVLDACFGRSRRQARIGV